MPSASLLILQRSSSKSYVSSSTEILVDSIRVFCGHLNSGPLSVISLFPLTLPSSHLDHDPLLSYLTTQSCQITRISILESVTTSLSCLSLPHLHPHYPHTKFNSLISALRSSFFFFFKSLPPSLPLFSPTSPSLLCFFPCLLPTSIFPKYILMSCYAQVLGIK